ncbi:SAM-dependent methyltransferase [Actinomadura miaoliensis]|uniref:27-O-demethylrifamycin SV methyltransferase n=1 Tax=Actinomadura miaoliensis TaxID=430685 RepID=A0ABP7WAM9_9ACTN
MSAGEVSVADEVAEIYDQTFWGVELVGGSFHVGYWWDEHDRTPFLEAINRNTEIVTGRLDLRPGQHLLDVGCGCGVPAIRVAHRADVRVTGITNSRAHRDEAIRRVHQAGLRGQVRIDLGDAAALPYPDASFDAVLSFESLVHADDRERWLLEMARVLRPGGHLVLTDLVVDVPLSDEDRRTLQDFTLTLPHSGTAMIDMVRRTGFRLEEFADITDRIRPTYPAYVQRMKDQRQALVDAYGCENIDHFLTGTPRILEVVQARTGYVIIVARRREGDLAERSPDT